jgi:thiosulfate reductase cytochrome b subunit
MTDHPVSGGKSDSEGGETLRQPLPIRLFHFLFLCVIGLKLWSGFAISFPLYGFPNLYSARLTHAIMTSLLTALLIFRLYLAFLDHGRRKLLVYRRHELREIGPWLRYYFFLAGKPAESHKYNIIQRLLFTGIFFSLSVLYASGVVLLQPPPWLGWLTLLLGGQGSARLVHYLFSVLLASLIVCHIYLSIIGGKSKLRTMFTGASGRPAKKRV